MLNRLLLTIFTAMSVLFLAFVYQAKSQDNPQCLTLQDAMQAHPASKFYRITGDNLEHFKHEYHLRFGYDFPDVPVLTFFEIRPDYWYLGVFDSNDCFHPNTVMEVDISIIDDLLTPGVRTQL